LALKQATNAYSSSATSVSDRAQFPGYKGDFTTDLNFMFPEKLQSIPAYRVLNRKGGIISESNDPKASRFRRH
jgi:hypothetical protein